ncbi:hypothetical protein pipiens_019727 [Culex pipiens pipiens]|uniref:Uncharacterized protein n=1 Tax=Culex pipiens pipiens TaxID=38569 RepID=A0ABD1DRZ7_CULPP
MNLNYRQEQEQLLKQQQQPQPKSDKLIQQKDSVDEKPTMPTSTHLRQLTYQPRLWWPLLSVKNLSPAEPKQSPEVTEKETEGSSSPNVEPFSIAEEAHESASMYLIDIPFRGRVEWVKFQRAGKAGVPVNNEMFHLNPVSEQASVEEIVQLSVGQLCSKCQVSRVNIRPLTWDVPSKRFNDSQ